MGPAVLFPIRGRNGRLVACQGRYVDGDQEPRMRTGGPKSLGVFATPGARQATELAIVEAPLDALSLAACGVPALALAGTTWPDWLTQACDFRRVLLATDADAAGEAVVAKLAGALRACGARVLRLRPQGRKTGTRRSRRTRTACATRSARCWRPRPPHQTWPRRPAAKIRPLARRGR
jgi:DNA primase